MAARGWSYKRPSDQLPKVIRDGSERVYAPWCPNCGSDEDTKWIAMNRSYAQAWCRRCDDAFSVSDIEAFQALEPGRLEARLTELRATECMSHEEKKP